jgi:hypothetical protein
VALALALGGGGGGKPPVPCPKVFLTEDTAHITAFRPGPGRDITDIDFQADLTGYTGSCVYDEKKLTVDLNVAFDVTRGPANATRKVAFNYFVAIPKVYPSAAGKRVFDVGFAFQPNQSRARFGDEIEVDVPLAKATDGPSYEIYLGFQLTPEQLDYNRKHRTPQ